MPGGGELGLEELLELPDELLLLPEDDKDKFPELLLFLSFFSFFSLFSLLSFFSRPLIVGAMLSPNQTLESPNESSSERELSASC